ncbi:MAG: glycoside hydrolase family protein [Verrucomicrobia bacterium]|nr:glycoside hydrolase family protein [Verrucomicrobiota bacterium]
MSTRTVRSIVLALLTLTAPGDVGFSQVQGTKTAKTFIDYFLPIPVNGTLSKAVWGAANVGPRDPKNGLEDVTMKQWDYWDGKIIKGSDGRYHMFASRWEQAQGHKGWFGSKAIHAVSDSLTGPYLDKELCWPNDTNGKGHNVTALQLPDGRYAIVVSETRPGAVFVSSSLDGPWKLLGTITVTGDSKWRASNEIILLRPDGRFQMFGRRGIVWISDKDVLGPYVAQGTGIYAGIQGLPKHDLNHFEDPALWYAGGLYHIVVNNWSDRKAYHLTSKDGITGWTYRGLAYDPTVDFIRYTDGTINRWAKLERPSVYIENGHVVAVTLAVIDVQKEQENGNDGHGSKVIVIPFDGAALDRDLQQQATK